MEKHKKGTEGYDQLVKTTSNVLMGRTCVLSKALFRFGSRLSVYFDKLVILRSLINNFERPSSETHLWIRTAQWLIISSDQEVLSSSLGFGYRRDGVHVLEGKTVQDVQLISGGAAIHFFGGISLLIAPYDETDEDNASWDLVYEGIKRISYDSTGAVEESEDKLFADEIPVTETTAYSSDSTSEHPPSNEPEPETAIDDNDFKDFDALLAKATGMLPGNHCFAARMGIDLTLHLHFDEPIILTFPKSRRKRLWSNTYLKTNRSNWLIFSSNQKVLSSSLGSGYGLDQVYVLEGKTITGIQVISGGAAIHFSGGISLFIVPYDETNADDIAWDFVYGGTGALTAQKVIGFYSDNGIGEDDVALPEPIKTTVDAPSE